MKKKNGYSQLLFNILGWYGALAILIGYLLISFAVLKPLDLTYQLLNLSGSIGLGIICWYKRTYQPLLVNVVWVIIATLATINILAFATG